MEDTEEASEKRAVPRNSLSIAALTGSAAFAVTGFREIRAQVAQAYARLWETVMATVVGMAEYVAEIFAEIATPMPEVLMVCVGLYVFTIAILVRERIRTANRR